MKNGAEKGLRVLTMEVKSGSSIISEINMCSLQQLVRRGEKKFNIKEKDTRCGEKLRCFKGYLGERELRETTLVITLF